jgi:deoxyribonuclease-4
MLIGAHVSTAGGLDSAILRGSAMGCRAIQIVNQSPRVWLPISYGPEDFDAFRRAQEDSPIESVVIHTSYLINLATRDFSLRQKSLNSLVHALQLGDSIGALGIVQHPGAQKGEELEPCLRRAADVILESLDESENCMFLLEHMAGQRAILGRDMDQLARLIEMAEGHERIGVCIDTCHLHAQGYDVMTVDGLAELLDEFDRVIGLERLRCVHLNDSRDLRGSGRDRHANLGAGAMGPTGLAAALSEPRFEGLPVILETPGPRRKGPDKSEIDAAYRLRQMGLAMRRAQAARPRRRRRLSGYARLKSLVR